MSTPSHSPLKFYFTKIQSGAIPATCIPGFDDNTWPHHAPVELWADHDDYGYGHCDDKCVATQHHCAVCNEEFTADAQLIWCTNVKHGFVNMHVKCLNDIDTDNDNATECPLCSWTLCLDYEQNRRREESVPATVC